MVGERVSLTGSQGLLGRLVYQDHAFRADTTGFILTLVGGKWLVGMAVSKICSGSLGKRERSRD